MKIIKIAILGLLACASSFAQASLVTISDTFTLAVSGAPSVGSFTVTWPTFQDAQGGVHPAGSRTITVAPNGAFTLQLYPTQGATPSTYYTVRYALRGGSSTTDYWLVPPSATPLTVKQVRVNQNIPPLPFLIESQQIDCVNCNVGDTLAWNGTAVTPVTFQRLFSGSFSGQSTVTVTGATHGQGTALITRWYDTSGNALAPAVVVNPVTGDVSAYFGVAKSGTYIIDGGLSSSLPNFSTGFFQQRTVTIPQSMHHFGTPNLDVAIYDTNGSLINSSAQIQVNPATNQVTLTFGSPTSGKAVVLGAMGTTTPPTFIATGIDGYNFLSGTPTQGQTWIYNATNGDFELGSGASYTLPPATTSSLGGVMVGSGLNVNGSGLLTANTGTSSGTVAAGNDARITGALQSTNNLSDLGSVTTARANLGLTGGSPATISSPTTGNAATATALAALPAGCSAGQFATGIQANGTAICSALPVAVPAWVKYTEAYTVLNTTAALSKTVTLFTLAARQKVCGVSIYSTLAFSGSGISTLGVTVGDSNGSATSYATPATNLMTTGYQDYNVLGSVSPGTGAVQAVFTSTGANLSALTAGSADIDLCVVTEP